MGRQETLLPSRGGRDGRAARRPRRSPAAERAGTPGPQAPGGRPANPGARPQSAGTRRPRAPGAGRRPRGAPAAEAQAQAPGPGSPGRRPREPGRRAAGTQAPAREPGRRAQSTQAQAREPGHRPSAPALSRARHSGPPPPPRPLAAPPAAPWQARAHRGHRPHLEGRVLLHLPGSWRAERRTPAPPSWLGQHQGRQGGAARGTPGSGLTSEARRAGARAQRLRSPLGGRGRRRGHRPTQSRPPSPSANQLGKPGCRRGPSPNLGAGLRPAALCAELPGCRRPCARRFSGQGSRGVGEARSRGQRPWRPLGLGRPPASEPAVPGRLPAPSACPWAALRRGRGCSPWRRRAPALGRGGGGSELGKERGRRSVQRPGAGRASGVPGSRTARCLSNRSICRPFWSLQK